MLVIATIEVTMIGKPGAKDKNYKGIRGLAGPRQTFRCFYP